MAKRYALISALESSLRLHGHRDGTLAGPAAYLVLQPHFARATSVTCRFVTDLAGDAGSGRSVTSTFSPGCSKVRL